jgi:hypothetical protein
MAEWIKVIFLADCIVEDWDEDKEYALCPICLIEYADCKHPGPSQEDEYEYQEINGELFAKLKLTTK